MIAVGSSESQVVTGPPLTGAPGETFLGEEAGAKLEEYLSGYSLSGFCI